MQTKYSKVTFISFILLTVFSILFFTNLEDSLNLNVDTFSFDETYTYNVGMNKNVYLLYDSRYNTDFYSVSRVNIYTKISFNTTDAIFVRIKNIDDNEYYYVDGFGETSSVKYGDYDALGTIELRSGEYEISITSASGAIPSNLEFGLVNSSIFKVLLSMFGYGFVMLITFIVFFGSYRKHRKEIYHSMEFDGHHYEHTDDNALFDEDDPYGDKHGKDPYGFEAEDDPYKQQRRR